MVVKTGFKSSFALTIIKFKLFFVETLASYTMHSFKQSFKEAAFFASAVAAAFFVGFCRKYLYVILLNNTGDVFHAAIA